MKTTRPENVRDDAAFHTSVGDAKIGAHMKPRPENLWGQGAIFASSSEAVSVCVATT